MRYASYLTSPVSLYPRLWTNAKANKVKILDDDLQDWLYKYYMLSKRSIYEFNIKSQSKLRETEIG